MDSCDDMQPHHSGLSPQTGPSPFTVTTEHSSFRLGEDVKGKLQANLNLANGSHIYYERDGNRNFKQ